MADSLKCIICEKRESCISDLHLHQTTCHSIDQLSLALLCCIDLKTDNEHMKNQDNNNNSSNTKKSRSKKSLLQEELKNCVSAIDKVLPLTSSNEGRRKKNPKPRKNAKESNKRKSALLKEITTIPDKLRKIRIDEDYLTEVDESKPIQQPQLSSTITTPLKRSLRKKTGISTNTKVNKVDLTKRKESSASRRKSKISANKKKTICSSDHNETIISQSKCTLLETTLLSKQSDRRRNQINVIDPLKMKYDRANNSNQDNEVKCDITWNKAYQNYIAGLQALKELSINQNKYIDQTDLSTHNTYGKHVQSQFYINNENEVFNVINNNMQNNFADQINQNLYHIEDKIDNELLNKTLIEPNELISDLKNITPEQLELKLNLNEESNVDGLSINLTNDVKDFIVEFFEEEENAKSRNPYWEDNMNKYFPSETESSSEIEQFNDGLDKYDNLHNHDNDTPLNLVISKQNSNQTLQDRVYYNSYYIESNMAMSSKEFAVCKSTWSADYINNQPETAWSLYENKKPCELSYAYRYKLVCPDCREEFINDFALKAHINYCKTNLNENQIQIAPGETVLDVHFYQKFLQNNNSLSCNTESLTNEQLSIIHYKYQCHACQRGFENRTNYCKHMLNHKKTFLQEKFVPCAACGILLENFNVLKNHFHKHM